MEIELPNLLPMKRDIMSIETKKKNRDEPVIEGSEIEVRSVS